MNKKKKAPGAETPKRAKGRVQKEYTFVHDLAQATLEGNAKPFSKSVHKRTASLKPPLPRPVASIDLYADGVRVNGYKYKGKQPSSVGGLRGNIKGWSTSSRRRMREFLLTHVLKDDYHCAGVTLTIPGPILSEDDTDKLWHIYQQRLRRSGGCAIWRREIQQRGASHWHLLAGLSGSAETVPDRLNSEWLASLKALGRVSFGRWVPTSQRAGGLLHSDVLTSTVPVNTSDWCFVGKVKASVPDKLNSNLTRLTLAYWGGKKTYTVFNTSLSLFENQIVCICGKVKHQENEQVIRITSIKPATCPKGWPVDYTGCCIKGYPDLSQWPGAAQHAVDVNLQKPNGAWKRYLQDHATKSKQEQLATSGRHWGVIAKTRFKAIPPDSRIKFRSNKAFNRFLRVFRRLRTPFVKCPKCIFGRKKGFPAGGGKMGSRVWFSRGDTVSRLAEWANDL